MGPFRYPEVDLSNATAVAVWYETHDIPQRYNAAIVVASVLVSILGAYSTLIVLGKRTSNAGVRNVALLVWAAMTMSVITIWGMHFIGMNFRLEPLPGQSWYVSFSPGFTVFSLIVPFIALVLAFVFVDYFSLKMWRIAVSGTLTGCIVGLMHYSASMRSNFKVSYAPAQTAVSIILACVCALVALTLFFRLRAQWQDSWQRRLLCSIILATGVSGMHYLGSSGTSYRMLPHNVNQLDKLANGRHSNTTVVIIVAVMAFVITIVSAFLSISDVLMMRETRKKARKIVVASASFDHLGRLLVQADGSLPLVVLEESTLRHTEVLEALDSRNDTFQWLYAVSWSWAIILPFLDAIALRIGQHDVSQASSHSKCKEGAPCPHTWRARLLGMFSIDGWSRAMFQSKRHDTEAAADAPQNSYNARGAGSRSLALLDFRDRVVDAANRLAEHLEGTLEDVGVFYDHVLPTGTQKKSHSTENPLTRHHPKRFFRRKSAFDPTMHSPYSEQDDRDDEASISTGRAASIFGDGDEDEEGVSMFLVRELGPLQQTLFAKRGYRFTETRFLANVLADRHGVSKAKMDELLDGLRLYARRGTRPVVQPNGVYAGLFGVRPSASARQGGLDVLVYNFARHQIPAFRLPDVAHLTTDMRQFLTLLDQMPVDQALRICERESIQTAERNKVIARLLYNQAQATQLRSYDSQVTQVNENLVHSIAAIFPDAAIDSSGKVHEDSLREMIEIQKQSNSLQMFQIGLYTALEALMQSVRVFPRLSTTARISADVLEVPSSLDDSLPPAQVILIQAVLPTVRAPVVRASASTLGGLIGTGNTSGFSASTSGMSQSHSLIMPTEVSQSGTPFVFTPYTLFNKTQMMLLRGKTAQEFTSEVRQALALRYNVHLTGFIDDEIEKSRRYSRSKSGMSVEDDFEMQVVVDEKVSQDHKRLSDSDAPTEMQENKGVASYSQTAKDFLAHLRLHHKRRGDDITTTVKGGDVPSDDHYALPTHVAPSNENESMPTESSYRCDAQTSYSASADAQSASVLPPSYGIAPPVRHGTGVSLGIRRFTQPETDDQRNAAALHAAHIDQSLFARPAYDHDEEGTVVSNETPFERNRSSVAEAGPSSSPTSYGASVRLSEPPLRSTSLRKETSSPSFAHASLASTSLSRLTPSLAVAGNRARSNTVGGIGSEGRRVKLDDSPRPNRHTSNLSAQSTDGEREAAFAASRRSPVNRSMSERLADGERDPLRRTDRAGSLSNPLHSGAQPAGISDSPTAPNSSTVAFAPTDVFGGGGADSTQARQRLDNWQLRHLRDLERFQPNLLLGVLPSEY